MKIINEEIDNINLWYPDIRNIQENFTYADTDCIFKNDDAENLKEEKGN